jgi:hypothetical protein
MFRLIVLHARYTDTLSYYDDWLDAFRSYPGFVTTAFDICRTKPSAVRGDVREADAVVLLHSTNADTLAYLQPWVGILGERKGRILAFPGNEVNLPGVSMEARIGFFREIEADFIATQHLTETGQWLYASCTNSRVVSIPHGLNPDVFTPGPSHARRRYDLVARSYTYPPYLGDDDRQRLFRAVADLPLKTDIDGTKRFDRAGWAAFLGQSRGTVSTEAGSFYLEPGDGTMNAIRDFVLGTGTRTFPLTVAMQRVLNTLPDFLRRGIMAQRPRIERTLRLAGLRTETAAFADAKFAPIFERFFKDRRLPPVYCKCISSRHFDAAGTETCQILIRGRYNDILQPDVHYIPVERDLSDLPEALRKFSDGEVRERMARETAQYLRDTHTYRHRMETVEHLLTASADNLSSVGKGSL